MIATSAFNNLAKSVGSALRTSRATPDSVVLDVLKAPGCELPADLNQDLRAVIARTPADLAAVQSLEAQIISLPADLLTCAQWLHLHEALCLVGRYPMAYVCREHARRLATRPVFANNYPPPISWDNTIAAYIEGDESAKSRTLARLFVEAGFYGRHARKWLDLERRLHQSASDGVDEDLAGQDPFAEFVANKSVALVGPMASNTLSGEEIDAHDAVIRINHSFTGKLTDPDSKGNRTDISYFSAMETRALMRDRQGLLPGELAWACFKKDRRTAYMATLNTRVLCRTTDGFDTMTFHGAYNMVPAIALDLAGFLPTRLKVFHTDLMLTVARARGYYSETIGKQQATIDTARKDFVSHDPILQYRVLEKMWRCGRVTGDPRFEAVMGMGLMNYLRELEAVYA